MKTGIVSLYQLLAENRWFVLEHRIQHDQFLPTPNNHFHTQFSGKVTITEGSKITLTITKFGPKDSGKYTITLTKADPEAEKDTATTELIVEDPKREKKIKAMFNEIDKDKSGEITNEELAKALRKANPGLDEEDVTLMIKESDENGDGVVEYHEFSMFMRKAGL